jgi:hypothetical protein
MLSATTPSEARDAEQDARLSTDSFDAVIDTSEMRGKRCMLQFTELPDQCLELVSEFAGAWATDMMDNGQFRMASEMLWAISFVSKSMAEWLDRHNSLY